MKELLAPATLGGLRLQTRFIMAPMTRARANADGTPGSLLRLRQNFEKPTGATLKTALASG